MLNKKKIKLGFGYQSIFIDPLHTVEDTENVDDVADSSLMNAIELIFRYFHTETEENLEIIKMYLIDIYFNMIQKKSRMEKLEYILLVLKQLFSVYTIKNKSLADIDVSDKILNNNSSPICLLELKIKINTKIFTWYTISYSGIIDGGIYNNIESNKNSLEKLDLWDIDMDLNLYKFPLTVHSIYLINLIPLI